MHTYVNPGSRTQTVGLGFMAAGALLALFGATFAWFMRGHALKLWPCARHTTEGSNGG